MVQVSTSTRNASFSSPARARRRARRRRNPRRRRGHAWRARSRRGHPGWSSAKPFLERHAGCGRPGSLALLLLLQLPLFLPLLLRLLLQLATKLRPTLQSSNPRRKIFESTQQQNGRVRTDWSFSASTGMGLLPLCFCIILCTTLYIAALLQATITTQSNLIGPQQRSVS